MSEIDEYRDLVELAEKQKDEKSRLEGSLEYIKNSLLKLGYKNITLAKADLAKKKILIQQKISKRDLKLSEFREKYARQIQKNSK